MIWWVLTYLDNYRPPHALGVLAETNLQAHLWMKWAKTRPARRAIYKRVRAVNVWCGYEYIWDTPNLVEQSQPGNTFEHLFGPFDLAPTDHVWYYLFSIGEAPYKECQGPLIHIPPPELEMASARIFHSIDQTLPPNAETFLTFDSVSWDDAFFYDPTDPTKLNIALGALYEFGACASFSLAAGNSSRLGICANAGPDIVRASEHVGFVALKPHVISIHTLWPLRPGDFLQIRALHTNPGGAPVSALPHYSPHFWVRLVGAYPA